MIFEADVDQIKRLNSLTFVQLMKRLMLAECRLADIPLRAAAVPLQITVADGGEDGRIEWIGGVDETDYFPTRFCVFQSKAQNMTEALVKAEILKKPESGPPKLNEAVLEVLSRRGAYIILTWMPLTIKTTGEGLSWHPALEAFIAEFGAADHVLHELSARLSPSSWIGSLVPYLEPWIPLLEMWKSHPLPAVRQWANHQTANLRSWIEQEKQRDEESIIRYT